jgi:hypothetical protein
VQLWGWVQQHRWLSVAVLVVVILSSAGGTCWAVFFRTVASPVSLRAAIRLYRQNRGDETGGDSGADQSAQSGNAAQTSTSTSPVAPKALLTPGVYPYDSTGGEGLSIMGMSRSFPSHTAMVVNDDPASACSTVSWVPIVQHTETTVLCPEAVGLTHASVIKDLQSDETIGGTTTTSVISCPSNAYFMPPIVMPGVHWSFVCHQDSPPENVVVTGLVEGDQPLDVAGQSVPTVHIHLMFNFIGVDQGTSPVDFWVATGRGLVVREQEAVHVAQGSVHYTETMSTRLTSLDPAGAS